MKKTLIIFFSLALIVLALLSAIKKGNGDMTLEGKGETNATELDVTVTRTEPTEIEEYAGSGDPDAFFEKYTIVKNNVIMRYSVNIKGIGDFLDVLDAVEIQTADGLPIVRHKNKLYILESDTVAREIANIWEQGYETVQFSMHDGDYVFTVNTELVDIVVEYAYSSYGTIKVDKLMCYELEGVSSVRLEVSNYASKAVRCFVIGADGETEILPGNVPERLWERYSDYLKSD